MISPAVARSLPMPCWLTTSFMRVSADASARTRSATRTILREHTQRRCQREVSYGPMTPPLEGMVPWPADITERYRARGYWTGETLGSAFDRSVAAHADRVAVVEG